MKFDVSIKSIRYKLMVIIIVTTLSALLVTSGILVYYDLRAFLQNRTHDIITQTEFLGGAATAALQFNDPDTAEEVLSPLQFKPGIIEAAIYNSRGKLFATYPGGSPNENFPNLPGDDGVTIDGDSLVSFKRIVKNDEILGTAYVRSRYEFNQRLNDYLRIVTSVTLFALFVAFLMSLWLRSMIIRPILSIADVAKQIIARREYSLRAKKISEDEVGALADNFNAMLDMIEQSTGELEQSNKDLAHEISERKKAEQAIRQLNEGLEKRVQDRTMQLEVSNEELESFCYSVSHDLRGPLRAIDGFSQALIEELPDEMPEQARQYFGRIRAATLRMGQLIEDLLNLSRISRGKLKIQPADLSRIAEDVIANLRMNEPGRDVAVSIWSGMQVMADKQLLRATLENLLGNSWKFTSKTEHPTIEVGVMRDNERYVYFVRDNGTGFDMAYADKLFGAFQRLHSSSEYPGTGIGLATVQRIIHRHGGRIWADATLGKGAIFYFTFVSDDTSAAMSPPPNAATEKNFRVN